MWKCARNVLPIGDNLLRRNIPSRSSCMRCGEPKTLIHLIFTACLLLIFGALSRGPRLLTPPSAPRFNWNWRHLELKSASPSGKSQLTCFLGYACWHIWIGRNQLIFDKRPFAPQEILTKAISACKEWENAQSRS